MSCYDPMTKLSMDQMHELVTWWHAAETNEIELVDQAYSDRGLRVTVDEEGSVWVTPTP